MNLDLGLVDLKLIVSLPIEIRWRPQNQCVARKRIVQRPTETVPLDAQTPIAVRIGHIVGNRAFERFGQDLLD